MRRKLHANTNTMNWIIRLNLTFTILFATLISQSQEMPIIKQETSQYSGFYIGTHASTNGYGLNVRYAFNDWFSLKTGYETLSFNYDFIFDENSIKYNADFEFNTGGVLFLADFSYAKNLYISAGAILNNYKPELNGYAISDLEYGDITIPAEKIGTFKMVVESEFKVAPYIAAGYQAFMGKRDGVVFNFETGLYYMGPPDLNIEADGLLSPTANPAFGQAEYLEHQFDAYKIYPIIKLNLAFKIF